MDFYKELISEELKRKNINESSRREPEIRPMKDAEHSTFLREEGEELFHTDNHSKQIHSQIWKLYCMSLVYAPIGSEEHAAVYNERSALLLHFNKLDDAIKDIDRALKITKLEELQTELRFRRKICCDALEEKQKEQSEEEKKKLEEELKIKKLIDDKEVEDPFKIVSVRSNEISGKHLVALRDIRPAEIISVERPLVTAPNLLIAHCFCAHCMQITWSSVPCHNCNWTLFCSEECREHAWQEYHDIECHVIPFIFFNKLVDYNTQLALRILVRAVRQYGSIAKLKKAVRKLESLSEKDQRKVFDGDHQFKFELFFLLTGNVPQYNLQLYIEHGVWSVIMLAKHSDFFGERRVYADKNEYFADPDFMFICALFFKLLNVARTNSQNVMGKLDYLCGNEVQHSCLQSKCFEVGCLMTPITSLLNHSCFPNVKQCASNDTRIMLYAVRPIKKNTQLFISYMPLYFLTSMDERQCLLAEAFDFICNCIACKEMWTPVMKEAEEHGIHDIHLPEFAELERKYSIVYAKLYKSYRVYDMKRLERIGKEVEKVMSILAQPSFTTAYLMMQLWETFEEVFGLQGKMPESCN